MNVKVSVQFGYRDIKTGQHKLVKRDADIGFDNKLKAAIIKIPLDAYRNEFVDIKIQQPEPDAADEYICCEALGKALGDHRGLHSQTIGSINSDVIDSIIVYTGGEYKLRNRIIVQYCPFCGKPRRRASEYKKEGK